MTKSLRPKFVQYRNPLVGYIPVVAITSTSIAKEVRERFSTTKWADSLARSRFGLDTHVFTANIPSEYLPEGYVQVRPIRVRLEPGGRGYVASSDVFSMWGDDTSKEGAISDFYISLAEDFLRLVECRENLGRSLSEELKELRKFFRKKE